MKKLESSAIAFVVFSFYHSTIQLFSSAQNRPKIYCGPAAEFDPQDFPLTTPPQGLLPKVLFFILPDFLLRTDLEFS